MLLEPATDCFEECVGGMAFEFFTGCLHIGSLKIDVPKPRQCFVFDQFRIFFLDRIEVGMLHEIPFGAFEEHEASQ